MNEELDGPFDAADLILNEQRSAQATALTALDAQPEQAQRAYELGEATGTDPRLVYPNVEQFDKQTKSAITSQLLNSNQYLQRFVQDPVKAALANDDLGELDATSEKLLEFAKHTNAPKEFFRSAGAAAVPAIGSLPAMAAGAKLGVAGGLALAPFTGPLAPAMPVIGGFVGAGLGGLGGGYVIGQVQEWLLSKLPDDIVAAMGMSPEARWAGAKLHPTASFLGGMAPFALTFKPTGAKALERGVSAAADAGFETGQQLLTEDQVNWQHVVFAALFGATFATPNRFGQPIWDQGTRAAEAFVGRVAPYLDQGLEPPAGIDPFLDSIKIAENEAGLATLDEALAQASLSQTRERNPDVFAAYLREHTDANIGISPDAITALYAGKPPTPDDGLLGWVPDLTQQMLEADATGADVRIPISEWLAKVDPAIATSLRDFIRIRPDGLTRVEAQAEQAALSDLPPDTPIDLIREVAGLKPLMAPAQRSLMLERDLSGQAAEGQRLVDEPLFHDFKLMDQTGKMVGYLNLSEQDGGKKLYIENIYGIKDPAQPNMVDPPVDQMAAANLFGPRVIRDVLRQIKATFPNAETIEGFRVSGAREKAGKINEKGQVSIKAAPSLDDLQLLIDNLTKRQVYDPIMPRDAKLGGDPVKFGDVEVQPLYTFSTKSLLDTVKTNDLEGVSRVLARFFGEKLKSQVGDVEVVVLRDADLQRAARADGSVSFAAAGFYFPGNHKIAISDAYLAGEFGQRALMEMAYEEAAHAFTIKALHNDAALRSAATKAMEETIEFLKETDPALLRSDSYYFKDVDEFIAIAMVPGEIQKVLAATPASPELLENVGIKSSFGQKMGIAKPASMWDVVRQIVKDLVSKLMGTKVDDTILDVIFGIGERVEAFNKATGGAEWKTEVEAKAAEKAEAEEKAAFDKAAAIGMTVEQYARYEKKIAEQQAAEADSLSRRALEEQTKRETALWKERAAAERDDAIAAVSARPDVAADSFIRHGELFGQKIEGPHRIKTDLVPEDVRTRLPREYFAANGVHPDDLAAMFGYPTGASMIEHMELFRQEQVQTGLRPAEYKRLLINQEVDRRVRAKYGDLEDNIIEAAKDQVISETQFEILHEETLGLATKAGLQFTLDQAQLKGAAQANFAELRIDDLTSDKFIASAGKAGRDAEMALLKGDAQEAFRQKQRQYFSLLYAREAKALEKAEADFAKTAKKFSTREVKGINQEYTNFIHALMLPAELKVRRSVNDIMAGIEADGNTTLDTFVARNMSDGWELDVAPDLLAGRVKPLEQMTVQEFREFKDAIDSLAYVGREVQKIEVAGQKREFEDFKREVIANITTLPVRDPQKGKRLLWSWDASLTRVEEMVRDLDLREELGPLFNAVVRPMMDAKHKEYLLQEDLSKKLNAIRGYGSAWIKTLDDTIPQNFLHDPFYTQPVLFDLTRANMINIMLNWGNKSNRWKFVRGYSKDKDSAKALEAQLTDLFERHATKEDWDFVQKMWDIFDGWKQEADTLYHNLSGLAPKWIEIEPVVTKHGTYKGGYFPVIYDRMRSNISVIQEKKGADTLFQEGYYRATTANRYTKERTGYAAPIEFSATIEQVAARMHQQMHDISYRAAVMQVGKIIYDPAIRAAIRKHYGAEYEEQLGPWLKSVANHYNMNEQSLSAVNNFIRRARMNLSVHALGLNLRVLLSPDMGKFNPAAATRVLSNPRAAIDLAWAKSKEIPHTYRNMDRDYRERLERLIAAGKWEGFQADAARVAFMPLIKVTQGFRIITFVDEYQKALARGVPDADAAAIADTAVRERHGATGIPDLPAVMRANEGMKAMTMFYGFFNAMYNWQRQIPGAIRDQDMKRLMGAVYGSILIPALFGALLFNKAEEDESWFKRIGKALILQPIQTIPFVRDAAAIYEGFPIRSPLVAAYDAIARAGRDAVKVIQGKKVEKPIKSAADALGMTLGLPLGQPGRTGQFLYDVNQRKEKPKNIFDWMNGLIHGTTKR